MPSRTYTPDLANRTLPLLRSIAQDIRDTALEMERLWVELQAFGDGDPGSKADPTLAKEIGEDTGPAGERRRGLAASVAQVQERFGGLMAELDELGIELKDPFRGLIDFRAKRNGREVLLCWQLGEESVAHWHEIDAGYAGRRPMTEF